jgi:hypothetical protein
MYQPVMSLDRKSLLVTVGQGRISCLMPSHLLPHHADLLPSLQLPLAQVEESLVGLVALFITAGNRASLHDAVLGSPTQAVERDVVLRLGRRLASG